MHPIRSARLRQRHALKRGLRSIDAYAFFDLLTDPSMLDQVCLASQIPWTRVPRICVSPPRVRRPASTLHRAASIRPVSPSLLSPIPAIAAT